MSDPHKHDLEKKPEPFGTLLGMAPGDVPAYSSDYATADDRQLPNRHAYRSYLDGIFLGYKWQCVEFARRWLYLNKGWIFEDVAMAYDIFRLRTARVIRGAQTLPLHAFANGAKRWPEPGALLIWAAGGEFEDTGHVAIITEVTESYVRVAEQNVHHQLWPVGADWAREIPARVTDEGDYWLRCSFGDAEILGWVIQTGDECHAEDHVPPDRSLFNLVEQEAPPDPDRKKTWLNVANEDEAAYVAMNGHELGSEPSDELRYYVLAETAHDELVRATNQLHALFMHATDFVLQDDRLLERFQLPRVLWPKIHQSWNNRRNQMITGRFDFSISDQGLKVYEYNCDSAACHMECGKVQGKWAAHYDAEIGRDAGDRLHQELRDAWSVSDVDGLLHIMQDDDAEETYHALFMKEAIERAGLECKVLRGVEGLCWDAEGNVLDPDGARIRWVWKTWAWETALDQIRAECEADDASRSGFAFAQPRGAPPRLSDVLLRPDVMVYEPLWTLVPSNKAILPILWELFPHHPCLLESSFSLTPELRRRGYVEKPIVGRCGSNIRIFDDKASVVEETSGAFADRSAIFQQRFPLPRIGEYYVQASTFTAGGLWAGSCVRVDRSRIITEASDNLTLRIVPDRELAVR